jgi:DNA-3-methyladenine glycosylase II
LKLHDGPDRQARHSYGSELQSSPLLPEANRRSTFRLSVRPPFRLDLTVWLLRRRPHNEIDRWDGATYKRILMLKDTPFEVAVSQVGSPKKPELEVVVTSSSRATLRETEETTRVLRLMLGLDVELAPFYKLARADPLLEELTARFVGFRPPRFPTLFEALTNAIACQQITLTVGITLLNRLCANWGPAWSGLNGEAAHGFVQPRDLIRVTPESLKAVGLSRQKAAALLKLAAILEKNPSCFGGINALTDEAVMNELSRLDGIGCWSAEYALLRGLGRLNVFPADDIAGRKRLFRWMKLEDKADYYATSRVLQRWSPYQGLIYFHLILASLSEKGWIN